MGNLFFKPATIRLKANVKAKILIKNTGEHTFTIDELGVNKQFSSASGTISFTPTKKGTFTLYCAVPGHKENGMVGKVIDE